MSDWAGLGWAGLGWLGWAGWLGWLVEGCMRLSWLRLSPRPPARGQRALSRGLPPIAERTAPHFPQIGALEAEND
jgi:hypothetical protein